MSDLLQTIRQTHRIGDTSERIVPWDVCGGLAARGMWFIGISNAGADYCMARPIPERAHLLVCFSGAGEVLAGGQWTRCGPGQAYLAPARVPMAFHTAVPPKAGGGAKATWGFAWVFLDSPPVERGAAGDARGGGGGAIPLPAPALVPADPRPLVNAIDGLYVEASHGARPRHLEAWTELVGLAVEDIVHQGHEADPLWRLWADVDAAPAEPWTVARLAARANLGPEALRRLCVAGLGRSPMRQVTHLRMRRAEAMLRSTPGKLFTIARAVGYENVFAFSTAFRRWKGLPPNACRAGRANTLKPSRLV